MYQREDRIGVPLTPSNGDSEDHCSSTWPRFGVLKLAWWRWANPRTRRRDGRHVDCGGAIREDGMHHGVELSGELVPKAFLDALARHVAQTGGIFEDDDSRLEVWG